MQVFPRYPNANKCFNFALLSVTLDSATGYNNELKHWIVTSEQTNMKTDRYEVWNSDLDDSHAVWKFVHYVNVVSKSYAISLYLDWQHLCWIHWLYSLDFEGKTFIILLLN